LNWRVVKRRLNWRVVKRRLNWRVVKGSRLDIFSFENKGDINQYNYSIARTSIPVNLDVSLRL